MRREVVGVLAIGALVGVAVFMVRIFLPDRLEIQWIALALVALAVVIVQAALLLRRGSREPGARRDSESGAVRRGAPRNPFVRELNREWTGLTDRIPDETEPRESPYQDEHIYDLPPTTPWRVDRSATSSDALPVPPDEPSADRPHAGAER